jgi:Glycosyl hydrolase family 12/Cellulose binding domain
MIRRLCPLAFATLLVAAAAIAVAATPPKASADTVLCGQYDSTTIGGKYVVMNNRWGTSATQCIDVTSTGFSIVQQDGTGNLSGAPVSYPAVYVGCQYGNCSPGSPLPMQIGQIGSVMTSTGDTYPSSGTYDAAYDIWLNADTNVSGVQDTEIMIWLNHTGSIQPIGSRTGTASIAGHSWDVWTGYNGQNNVISYVANPAGIASLSFDVKAFINDTLSRGSLYGNTSWYLTSVQDGFEPWIGGVGLAVTSFSASISSLPTQPTPTPTGTPSAGPTLSPTPTGTPSAGLTLSPTPPPSPTPSQPLTTPPPPSSGGNPLCAAYIQVDNSWGSGFTATVTVINPSTIATMSWTVTWTWPGSQTFVNVWRAASSGTLQVVVMTNLSYDGAIGPGSSTSFGFQANGIAVALPLSCTAS